MLAILESLTQADQQIGELAAAPLHPETVGVVCRWLLAGFIAVERAGVVVVAQVHRPGEVIIKLNAIGIAAADDLTDQSDDTALHPGVGRVEPDPQIAQR